MATYELTAEQADTARIFLNRILDLHHKGLGKLYHEDHEAILDIIDALNAPRDLADLLAEVRRLRGEVTKVREFTEADVEAGAEVIKPMLTSYLTDFDAEDLAWDAARAALTAVLGGGDDE